MSGVGVSGMLANLPGTVTPYPTQDPELELGGYRSVANAATRDAIPANFRSVGMAVTLQDTGVEYKLVGGITNADWVPQGDAAVAFVIRANLAALTTQDNENLPNGCQAYVVAEQEIYQLDTADALTTFSPLIIARGGGGPGKWYRRSRAYVVGNYTLWCESFGFGAVGFTPGQFVTGTFAPDIALNFGGLPGTGQEDVIVDNLGNLWCTFNGPSVFNEIHIRKFLIKDCLRTGTPPIAVTIDVPVPASSESGCSLFDRDGALWTNNGTHGAAGVASFLRYGQRAYQQPEAIADTTLVSINSPSTSNVQSMIVDGAGNLWASLVQGNNGAFTGAIVMFTRAQLQAGGSGIAPSVYWTGSNFSGSAIGSTMGMAFAANGWLWCAQGFGGSAIRAWNTVGAASGNPAPNVIITCAAFANPYTLAFDPAGNLWTQNAVDNRLMRIPKAQLGASGVVVPDVIITSTVALGNITFPHNPDKSGVQPSGWP